MSDMMTVSRRITPRGPVVVMAYTLKLGGLEDNFVRAIKTTAEPSQTIADSHSKSSAAEFDTDESVKQIILKGTLSKQEDGNKFPKLIRSA